MKKVFGDISVKIEYLDDGIRSTIKIDNYRITIDDIENFYPEEDMWCVEDYQQKDFESAVEWIRLVYRLGKRD